jgi:Protein of unknown function (DUF3137)
MNTFFFIALTGAIILVLIVALGWLKSKIDGTNTFRALAAQKDWNYESRGNSGEWSCSVAGKYMWRAREVATDNKSTARRLEFKARILGVEEALLSIGGNGDEVTEPIGEKRATTSSKDFDRQMHVTTNRPALAVQILSPEAMNEWLSWPQTKPADIALSISDGWLSIQITNRGFIDKAEPEKFLLFCDAIVKRILQTVTEATSPT